jgi:cytidylate kinase
MVVITMSRQRGSLGSYIALEVARRLDLRYLDREIITSVAEELGVPVARVQAIEDRAGNLARLLNLLGVRPKLPSIASASLREQGRFETQVGALMRHDGLSRESAVSMLETGGGVAYSPRKDYLDLITSVILESAQKGQAMIVGRGGQMILRRRPGVLHVQTIARFETRVLNICKREEVKWREAAHRVHLSDEQRSGYLRRFYNVDWLDASLYDLVINTDQIPVGAAVDLIAGAATALAEQALTEGEEDTGR